MFDGLGEVLQQLGGGTASVMVAVLLLVVYKMYDRIGQLQDLAIDRERAHSRELMETIRLVDKVLSELERTDR